MTDSTNTTEVPVLVVGAGPAGLVTAITLARYGIETLLVERATDHSGMPRATVISVRSMELLRSWDLEREIDEGALDVVIRGRYAETLTGPGDVFPLGYPTAEEAARVSPVSPVCAPQDHLEPVLARHLEGLPSARLRLGAELLDVAVGREGVLARIRDVGTGRSETIAARYLVGADGVRSRVREALGVAVGGPGWVGDGAHALFRAPLWERIEPPHYGLYPILHPEAEGVFVPAGRGDRWIYGYQGDPGTLATPEPDAMTERIRTAAGVSDLEPRIERLGRFKFSAGIAERFRVESAFLAGDAAHRVTPRGGTGMNTAIRSGHDLGWKLAWVLRGWAGEELLDSYERERRPAAEHNVRRSADPNGTRGGADDALALDLGGRIPHVWVDPMVDRVSSLDLLDSGLTLFTHAAAPPADCTELAGDAPVTVRELRPRAAEELGIAAGESLLVRPDGLPLGRPCEERGAIAAEGARVR